jgi:hypothetical protein
VAVLDSFGDLIVLFSDRGMGMEGENQIEVQVR